MVNILVPTDFSQLSKSALKYAIKIANRLDGNVTVLHVMTMTRALRLSMMEKIRSSEHNMMDSAEAELEVMIKTIAEQYKATTPVRHQVVRA